MIDTILQIVYILITIAMVTLILLQRGAGAQAGSGFGAGASGTVFGARGSTNFMTKATKWLAVAFFGLSLFMAWKAVNINKPVAEVSDIGVMSNIPVVPVSKTPAIEPTPVDLPAVPVAAPDALVPAPAPVETADSTVPVETAPAQKK